METNVTKDNLLNRIAVLKGSRFEPTKKDHRVQFRDVFCQTAFLSEHDPVGAAQVLVALLDVPPQKTNGLFSEILETTTQVTSALGGAQDQLKSRILTGLLADRRLNLNEHGAVVKTLMDSIESPESVVYKLGPYLAKMLGSKSLKKSYDESAAGQVKPVLLAFNQMLVKYVQDQKGSPYSLRALGQSIDSWTKTAPAMVTEAGLDTVKALISQASEIRKPGGPAAVL